MSRWYRCQSDGSVASGVPRVSGVDAGVSGVLSPVGPRGVLPGLVAAGGRHQAAAASTRAQENTQWYEYIFKTYALLVRKK